MSRTGPEPRRSDRVRSRVAGLVFGVGLTLLAGCAPLTMRGKVIQGAVAYVALVDETDARLDGPGVAGVRVWARSATSLGEESRLGQTTSDENGRFTLPIKNSNALNEQITVSARADGFALSRAQVFAPRRDQRVLVILQRTGPDTSGGSR